MKAASPLLALRLAIGLAASPAMAAGVFLPSQSQPPPLAGWSAGDASLTVMLGNTGGHPGGWRLKGEKVWRAGGGSAADLVAGLHWLELMPLPGKSAPPGGITVQVHGGQAATAQVDYVDVPLPPTAGGGWVRVESPADYPAPDPACWRLAGETAWRPVGSRSGQLPAGLGEVEFRSFAGYLTPDPGLAEVIPGQGVVLTAGYFPEASGDWEFTPLSPAGLDPAPACYVGRIHGPRGVFTGTAVGQYTVLTTLDAVFDPVTRTFVGGVTWQPAVHAGHRIPAPVKAAGFVLLTGYDNAQLPDAGNRLVAVYFTKPAADGGWSGHHVAGAGSDWLSAGRPALSVGYASEHSGAAARGKLHQTTTRPLAGWSAGGVMGTIPGFPDRPGLRGAALFTAADDGRFHPAAVFLGGPAGNFRVIDAAVAAMIRTAEESALLDNGGTFNLGEKIGVGSYGPGTVAKGRVRTWIDGSDAGRWKLAQGSFLPSGQLVEADAGQVRVVFEPLPGFEEPSELGVTVVSSTTVEVLASYRQDFADWESGEFSEAEIAAGRTGAPADFDGDGVINLFEWAFGLDPRRADARIAGQTETGLPWIETVSGGESPRLTVHYFRRKSALAAGVIYRAEFSADPAGGWLTAEDEQVEDLSDGVWERVTVIDPAPGGPRRFARVAVDDPAESPPP